MERALAVLFSIFNVVVAVFVGIDVTFIIIFVIARIARFARTTSSAPSRTQKHKSLQRQHSTLTQKWMFQSSVSASSRPSAGTERGVLNLKLKLSSQLSCEVGA